MTRPSKTAQEQGYVKDWWTEARTIEAEYHGHITLTVNTTTRPGVFACDLSFMPLIERTESPLGLQRLVFTYPNVEQSTLASFLWRKVIALGRMIAAADELPRTSNNTRG